MSKRKTLRRIKKVLSKYKYLKRKMILDTVESFDRKEVILIVDAFIKHIELLQTEIIEELQDK